MILFAIQVIFLNFQNHVEQIETLGPQTNHSTGRLTVGSAAIWLMK
jgi:hypothetical protein